MNSVLSVCVSLFTLTGVAYGSVYQWDNSSLVEFSVTEPPPIQFGTAVAADFDGDGDLELVVSGWAVTDDLPNGLPMTRTYSYEGIATILVPDPVTGEPISQELIDFQQISSRSTLHQVWKSAMAVGDLDGDNRADLAISGLDADGTLALSVYEYSPFSTQFIVMRTLPGLHSGDLEWGDMNNDGDQDLAACGFNAEDEPELIIYINSNRSLSPSISQISLVQLAVCSLEWGDYDADGDMDLVVAGMDRFGSPVLQVYDNDGAGGLVNSGQEFEGLAWPSVAWGDFDTDGDLDLLHSGARFTPLVLEGIIKLYANGSGSLVDESDGMLMGAFENDPATGRYDGKVSWGDYKNSGYPGIAITGLESPTSTETLALFPNLQGMQLRRSDVDIYDGGANGTAFWADFDGDLDLDMIVVGESRRTAGNVIRYLRNDARLGRRAPSAPEGSEAAVRGRRATLSWSAATDPQTPSPGLTYNLRVGTRPGGSDVMSPLSNLETGARLVSKRGNAGHNLSWTLSNLAPGTYYWSVQAVDQAFAGSGFTAEQQFTVDG
ncbi:MAG: VCBS repeat-containing protein [Bacteroidota bacterium]|nr:VCBS repeat-containing protein [Bacteroidota bacterium]